MSRRVFRAGLALMELHTSEIPGAEGEGEDAVRTTRYTNGPEVS
ncbi:hypothetical protein STANM337S_06877 [Streptomyces tanashiensis]